MAFKPSERRTVDTVSTDLDLRPIMNLMCILIPLLLSCAQFVKNTVIDITLPPVSGGISDGGGTPPDGPEKPKIGLKLVVTEKGITIASNAAILTGAEGAGPTVPNTAAGYDYLSLEEKLKDIVKSIKKQNFEDERTIIITAEDDVDYQSMITIVDVVRLAEEIELKDAETGIKLKQPWFLSIGFGKFVF